MSNMTRLLAALQPRRKYQRGAYAVELALVFPLFIIFVLSIFVFSFAFMSRHLLENLSAETARQCVARNHKGGDSVQQCVAPLGHWLASKMPRVVCWGQPISFNYYVQSSGVAGTTPGYQDYIDLPFLVVTASCQWTFVPGKTALGSVDTLPMPDSDLLRGTAAVPYANYSGPP